VKIALTAEQNLTQDKTAPIAAKIVQTGALRNNTVVPAFADSEIPHQTAVRLRGVRRVFPNGVTALDGIDLDVQAGEFLSILGPSGCGKSTLLRLIARLDRPQAGEIDFGGNQQRPPLAFVFQDPQLLPWRSVRDNVALPLELAGMNKTDRLLKAEKAIVQVGLADAMERYPAQLSGGMRMRASIARALTIEPRLLLLDEPFAALDEITRQRLDEQLRELWMSRGLTVLFVTHSIAEAVFLARRVIVMSRRPGRILIDRPIRLPEQRTPQLRTAPQFAEETRDLFDALRSQSVQQETAVGS
jgi:NitT/TauT family transport system ATP-binding protein